MKPKLLGIAITFLLIDTSNYSIAKPCFPGCYFSEFDQSADQERLSEKEEENAKRNQEAIVFLNDLIKNLNEDRDTDRIKALKATRDYIRRNLKKDPISVIGKGADEGKKTAEGQDNKKTLKEYVDKVHSATVKKIFKILLSAKGTGRTTGHIADLMVTNNSSDFISLQQ